MGWFFVFKLHLIINGKGEILNFMFTPTKVNNRELLRQGNFLKEIKRIGSVLLENQFLSGIQLLTKVKNKMKNSLMSVVYKILLRRRTLIEAVTDELKSIVQINT